ncbi:hypothetical protein TNCV_2526631 [Trichonephila clavipes]|nr:hypothetical protein TNCV_2526631 [Trichonephila clavipes]
MVGVSRRPTWAVWRGKEIEPVQNQGVSTQKQPYGDRASELTQTLCGITEKRRLSQVNYGPFGIPNVQGISRKYHFNMFLRAV